MKTENWLEGLKRLAAALPSQDQDPSLLEERGKVYRSRLDRLTEDQWEYAVNMALDQEKWFPTISKLLEYGNQCPWPNRSRENEPRPMLPRPPMASDEWRKRYFEEQRAMVPKPAPKPEPPKVTIVEATEERLEALRLQRAMLQAAEGTGTE